MRIRRALLLSGCLAGAVAAARPAAAQDALPDDGPSREQIELVSGDVIAGTLVDFYYHENAQPGDAYLGFIIDRADGVRLYVPAQYFSKAQEYWVMRRLWMPGPAQHPIYRPKPEDPEPVVDAYVAFQLAQKALWAGPELWKHSKAHYEQSIQIAATDTDPKTDPEAWRKAYVGNLAEYGLKISEKDGGWVDEATYYTEIGWKKWRDKWYPKDEYDRLVKEAAAKGKRDLSELVPKPEEYTRVHLDMVRSFPGLYLPGPKGELPRVRFFARYLMAPEEKYAAGLPRFKAPEYLRLRVANDDCAHVYVPTKSAKLVERAKAFTPGEAVEIYGRMVVVEGLVIIECDGIALR